MRNLSEAQLERFDCPHKREEFEVSKEIIKLTKILSQELELNIFGFDLVKPLNQKRYYLIDLNDFPGYRGIKNIENVLVSYFKNHISKI